MPALVMVGTRKGAFLLQSEGSLRPYLLLFVNEEPAGLDAALAPGARVRVVTSVAGG